MALTKANIVENIQSELKFSKNKSLQIVDAFIETIRGSLKSGDDVLISGFGKFCVNSKKERRGRNPATGSDMMLNARRVVTFRCSQTLRKKVNGK